MFSIFVILWLLLTGYMALKSATNLTTFDEEALLKEEEEQMDEAAEALEQLMMATSGPLIVEEKEDDEPELKPEIPKFLKIVLFSLMTLPISWGAVGYLLAISLPVTETRRLAFGFIMGFYFIVEAVSVRQSWKILKVMARSEFRRSVYKRYIDMYGKRLMPKALDKVAEVARILAFLIALQVFMYTFL